MQILVTGAAGYIGSNLSEHLLSKKYKVIGIDNFNNYYSPKIKEYNIKDFKDKKNFKLYKIDILDYEGLKKIFDKEKIDAIVHLAAWAGVTRSISEPITYLRNNIEGTTNLAEMAVANKVKTFIFASTSSIYGDNKTPFIETMNTDHPLAPYPASKKACELILYTYSRNFNLPVTILRIFNPLGPRQRPDLALTQLIRSCLYGIEFKQFQDSDKTGRDYTYVGHLLESIDILLKKPFKYEIFNMGNSKPITLGKFISTIEKVVGKSANVVKGDKRQGEMELTYSNTEKARRVLGYKPSTSIEENVRIYYEWFLKQEDWYKKGQY